MEELLNLGELYVSDFVTHTNGQPKGELKIVWDNKICAARIEKPVSKDLMYGKYWYHSGTNETMKRQLKDVVDSILPTMKFNDKDVWLDIACNDGTLLEMVPKSFTKVGFDPAEDKYLQQSRQRADIVIPDYFSEVLYTKMMRKMRAKVVTTIAMFYDLEDPISFAKEVYNIMDDEGIWVIQMSYTPLMFLQNAFDNICHEHIYYHSIQSMEKISDASGFNIVDVSMNDTNGGSFRLFLRKKLANKETFQNAPMRDVCTMRVEQMRWFENRWYGTSDWKVFLNRIKMLKEQVRLFIRGEKERGKKICGYGASTKGNTLLQYFGLDNTLIDFIVDANPAKNGLKTIGTDIPIATIPETMLDDYDYVLILPWHFIGEFKEKLSFFIERGGKLIVCMPEFQIIDK